MISQYNNIITLSRGDSYEFSVNLTDDFGQDYVMQGRDTLYMGIMDPHQPFEDALVKKKFVTDNRLNSDGQVFDNIVNIAIFPEDTLDLIPGKYYYAIKLHMDHNEVDGKGNVYHVDRVCTIINKTKFIVLE